MPVTSFGKGVKEGESVAKDLKVLEGLREVGNEESSPKASSKEQDLEPLP